MDFSRSSRFQSPGLIPLDYAFNKKRFIRLNKRILDMIIFSFYIGITIDLSYGFSIYLQRMFHTSLFHFHTRLASFPRGFANSFENVGFLSNYSTGMLDSVSLSRLSARNWHTSTMLRCVPIPRRLVSRIYGNENVQSNGVFINL